MTEELFDAIHARFTADVELNRIGREVYQGFAGERAKSVLPYAEVYFGAIVPEDTFGDDLEVIDCHFNLFTKRLQTGEAARFREHVIRVFDDCDLNHGAFHMVGFQRIGGFGPRLVDGVYQTVVDYRVSLQRAVKSPAVRGV